MRALLVLLLGALPWQCKASYAETETETETAAAPSAAASVFSQSANDGASAKCCCGGVRCGRGGAGAEDSPDSSRHPRPKPALKASRPQQSLQRRRGPGASRSSGVSGGSGGRAETEEVVASSRSFQRRGAKRGPVSKFSPEHFGDSDDADETEDVFAFGGEGPDGGGSSKGTNSPDALRSLRTLQLLGALLQQQQRQVYANLSNDQLMAAGTEKIRLMNDYEAGIERVTARPPPPSKRHSSSRSSQVGSLGYEARERPRLNDIDDDVDRSACACERALCRRERKAFRLQRLCFCQFLLRSWRSSWLSTSRGA